MGTFYIGFERDEGPGLRRDVQVAAPDVDRVVRAYGKLYFPSGVLIPGSPEVPEIPGQPEIPPVPARDEIPAQEAVLDDEGNVVTPAVEYQPAVPAQPGTPAVEGVPGIPAVPDSYREPTGAEVFEAMAKGLLEGILANVVSVEKAEAVKAAQEAVAPIVVQPVE